MNVQSVPTSTQPVAMSPKYIKALSSQGTVMAVAYLLSLA